MLHLCPRLPSSKVFQIQWPMSELHVLGFANLSIECILHWYTSMQVKIQIQIVCPFNAYLKCVTYPQHQLCLVIALGIPIMVELQLIDQFKVQLSPSLNHRHNETNCLLLGLSKLHNTFFFKHMVFFFKFLVKCQSYVKHD